MVNSGDRYVRIALFALGYFLFYYFKLLNSEYMIAISRSITAYPELKFINYAGYLLLVFISVTYIVIGNNYKYSILYLVYLSVIIIYMADILSQVHIPMGAMSVWQFIEHYIIYIGLSALIGVLSSMLAPPFIRNIQNIWK